MRTLHGVVAGRRPENSPPGSGRTFATSLISQMKNGPGARTHLAVSTHDRILSMTTTWPSRLVFRTHLKPRFCVRLENEKCFAFSTQNRGTTYGTDVYLLSCRLCIFVLLVLLSLVGGGRSFSRRIVFCLIFGLLLLLGRWSLLL